MAKRSQPDNVYWEGDGGRVYTSTNGETAGFSSLDEMAKGSDPGVALQGTLFDPESGSGTKFDPLITPERRREAVQQRYDVQDPGVIEKISQSSISTPELLGMGPNLAPDSRRGLGRPSLFNVPGQPARTVTGMKLRVDADPAYVESGAAGSYDQNRHSADVLPDSNVGTVMHEIGHGEHLRGDVADGYRRNGPDPLFEGVADGFADRYEAGVDLNPGRNDVDPSLPTVASSPSKRHETMEDPNRGYSTNFSGATFEGKHYPGWEDDTDRALYAAARQHVATSGQVVSSDFRGEHVAKKLLSLSQFSPDDMDPKTGMRGFRDKLGLGRLVYENPESLHLFQTVGPEHTAEWLNMRNAASDAVTAYKTARDTADVERGRRPLGPEAGWKASEEGMRRHNEAVQSSTLPLVDPQTGQQYDNTVAAPEHPLPRIEHTKMTARESAMARAAGIRKTLEMLDRANGVGETES